LNELGKNTPWKVDDDIASLGAKLWEYCSAIKGKSSHSRIAPGSTISADHLMWASSEVDDAKTRA
jgi:hypothetical protein